MSDFSPAGQPTSAGASWAATSLPATEVEASCRLPVLLLCIHSAAWLLVASIFALISSIKFHAPAFLGQIAWLTYGRVHAAYLNSILYGFCLQAGVAVGLWLLVRLGGTLLAQPLAVAAGGVFWNLGVALGVGGILAGDSTGYDTLEMPGYAVMLLAVGYLMMGTGAMFTFHQRRRRQLFGAQWFLFTALFWFPWIFSTAELLLVWSTVRGITQSVIAWWYAHNLQYVWLWLAGLSAVFYLVPKLTKRDLNSRYLALFTFWMLILRGSWGGIPSSAPVPAWLPALSTVTTTFMVLPLLSVALSLYYTAGRVLPLPAAPLPLRFIWVGVLAFLVAGIMLVANFLPGASRLLDLTWFGPARVQLNFYGFFAFVMFGAIYYLVPRVTGIEFPFRAFVRAHFWLALAGIVLISVPLAIAGVVEGFKLQDPRIPFVDVTKATLPFLRVSTLGDLALAIGHVLFMGNLVALAYRLSRAHATTVYHAATEDLFKPVGVNS